jgi:hypothetical protein
LSNWTREPGGAGSDETATVDLVARLLGQAGLNPSENECALLAKRYAGARANVDLIVAAEIEGDG